MPFDSLKRVIALRTSNDPRMHDFQIARIFEASRHALIAVWGEQKAALVGPLSFREGLLKFETASPTAKQQLGVDKLKLKNEINRRLGGMTVREIQIQSKGF
ncbi:MAG: DciA family protein [Patescibacteria group bacterium]